MDTKHESPPQLIEYRQILKRLIEETESLIEYVTQLESTVYENGSYSEDTGETLLEKVIAEAKELL